ncbi:Low-molecular weight cobalt-containing nitrile hydratase subunit beta [Shimia sp. SK013]|uniref:nitrile hydratase subunit beta n=1 Tax=Shimia sp. SK013 TaxID=1389006 RepID=UPI0006B69912|nr:nitrile hydratase subunit beta [Shimia sp. SK013]KPA22232.1 Low-molecular weight cobalt-containing nitrile hydratase subunit beta [Shimia sp. SK013]
MSRIHDMGGRFGTGAVDPDDNATFAKTWHERALALNLACGALGQWNIDASRHARECLSAADYAGFSYYEKWLGGLTDSLVAKGVLTLEELDAGRGDGVSPLTGRALKAENVAPALAAGSPYTRDTDAAMFAVGDRVQVRRPARNVAVSGGHTRLPAYAAGAVGVIELLHGAHVFPDSNAHGLGEAPEPLYAVRFAARALWGNEAEADDEMVLDLWQSYLEPA